MNLDQIAEKLNEEFNFPFQIISSGRRLTDSVSIRISLQKEEDWLSHIFYNSPFLLAHIYCDDRYESREKEDTTYSFEIGSNMTKINLRQRKGLSGEKITEHVIKQLKKLQ